MESLIEETKQEIKDLKIELSECEENIKNATTEEERKEFLEEKNEIQNDIAEIEAEIENMLELEKAQQEEGKTEE